MKRVLTGLIAVVALIVGLRGIQQASHAEMLRRDHATVRGAISSKAVGSHGVVEYTYEVGGAQYHGRDVGGEERGFGEATTVYYLPGSPSVSALHDPTVRAFLGWPGVVMPFVIALGFVFVAARGDPSQRQRTP